MAKVTTKVLYFCSGAQPTNRELADIARLETVYRQVLVRRGDVAADASYGSGREELAEEIEAGTTVLAGPNIPAAYSGITNAVTLTIPSSVNPDQFKLFPAAVTLDASNADVQQLAAVKAEIDAATGLAKMTDLAADASVTYASSDATKATVSASGVVTAVAAGSTTITATLQAAAAITGIAGEADDDTFTKAAHGLETGMAVDLLNLGSGTGFGSVGNTRYVIKTGANTFKLATSYANAIAGTAVDITGDATNASMCRSRVTSTCAVTVQA